MFVVICDAKALMFLSSLFGIDAIANLARHLEKLLYYFSEGTDQHRIVKPLFLLPLIVFIMFPPTICHSIGSPLDCKAGRRRRR